MQTKSDDSEAPMESTEVHFHVLKSGQQFLLVRHFHAWHPPTDVMVDEDHLTVIIEVPGMQSGEFHVTFANQRLSISGERPPRSPGHAAYYQLEVRYGEFRTDVVLPWAVDEDAIVARYEDGFLQIEIPRAKPHKVRVVEVDRIEDR